MKIVKDSYYGSPRWTAEVADCSMPMTFDQYSNCGYVCLYCFATFQRAIGDTKDDYLTRNEAVGDHNPNNVIRVADYLSRLPLLICPITQIWFRKEN